jgi:hypothetical protein
MFAPALRLAGKELDLTIAISEVDFSVLIIYSGRRCADDLRKIKR